MELSTWSKHTLVYKLYRVSCQTPALALFQSLNLNLTLGLRVGIN